MTWRGVVIATVAVTAGCGGREETPPAESAETAQPAAPADSLVATAPGGVEIWFTLAREGKAADGTTCTDRTLEIRHGDRRVPVPLLYTGTAPEIVNDSTMRARLSDRCAPGDAYLVDLRTGRPVRER
ncbi:MAG TPA: hypothetical protein VJ794_06060 [Gemmatimonadales bacterium]|nr:hypothetical protein [Gemmatimonadales bacterium]